jgi:pimeloyl-ACP methyl ester carboxylesterase
MRQIERKVEPADERIELPGGLRLRVLRWISGSDGSQADGTVGPPFLLVHGLASNARLWDGVARRLAEAGRTAVAVDLRGHGRSDKPDDGYDFATISGDLRSLVQAIGLERPIVAGQSWGAGVVLDLAVRYPEMVRGIVLVDGGLTDMQDSFPSWEVCWERLAPPQLAGIPLATVEGYFRTNHADWPEEGIEGSLGNFEIRPDRTISPWLSREHHRAILRAMWEQRTAEQWRALRVPALIVPVDGGESDWTRGKRSGAEQAVSLMEGSGTPIAVRWFSGDHDIHAQHPAELTEAILDQERNGLFGGRP